MAELDERDVQYRRDAGFSAREAELQEERAQEQALEEGEERNDGVFIEFAAKTRNGRDTVRPYEFADRESGELVQRVEITLPQRTILADGRDVSFYRFSASPRQLDPGGVQRRYDRHTVLKSSVDRDTDEPVTITLKRDFGGRDGSGKWVSDIDEIEVKPEALKDACLQQMISERQYQKALSERYAKEQEAAQGKDAPGTAAGIEAVPEVKATKVEKPATQAASPKEDKALAAASATAQNAVKAAPKKQRQMAKA